MDERGSAKARVAGNAVAAAARETTAATVLVCAVPGDPRNGA